MLSRVIVGVRDMMIIAPLAVLLGTVLGTAIGLVMGYFRGFVDESLGRFSRRSWRCRWSSGIDRALRDGTATWC